MIKILIKRFIKNYEQVNDPEIRKAYGMFSGILGVILNILLFMIKIITGFIMNSIAIISDAFNNLTDSASSVVTIYGASLSNKPPDKEHPYGHGRMEYIASLVVAFIIIIVGIQLLSSSAGKIFNPVEVEFSLIAMVFLVLSVFIKLWMFSYNRYIGKTINSSLNFATAKDSLNDVIATSGIIVGTIVGMYVNFPVDGVLGLLISLLIICTGFSTAKDAINDLLGPSPDPEIYEKIEEIVSSTRKIRHCHDLHVHDYGPGRKIASMHVVVPPHLSVEKAHDLVHSLEEKIKNELGIKIVIHIDPSEHIDEKLAGKHETSNKPV